MREIKELYETKIREKEEDVLRLRDTISKLET